LKESKGGGREGITPPGEKKTRPKEVTRENEKRVVDEGHKGVWQQGKGAREENVAEHMKGGITVSGLYPLMEGKRPDEKVEVQLAKKRLSHGKIICEKGERCAGGEGGMTLISPGQEKEGGFWARPKKRKVVKKNIDEGRQSILPDKVKRTKGEAGKEKERWPRSKRGS